MNAGRAAELGRAGRVRIEQRFTIDASIAQLGQLVEQAARHGG